MNDLSHLAPAPAANRQNKGRKVNLLIATEGLGIGGAEVVIQRLAESLDPGKFNITLACLKVLGGIGEDLQRKGFEVAVLTDPAAAAAQKVNYLTFLGLLKLIRARNIDVVHTHTLDALADSALCRLFRPRTKVIHTFHFGNYPHRDARALKMERFFSRFATRLYAVGEVQRNALKEVLRIEDTRVGRVWNGVAFAAFREQARLRAPAVKAPGDPVHIGTLATLTEQKGLFDLLAVAKKLRAERNVRFVIIGDGPLRSRLEAGIREHGLEDTVRLAGWVQDAAHVALPAVDIFFQPSLWEAMSIALLEGMAAGKAIVATGVGENPHVIEHGVDGLIVEKRDIDGMTAALRRLVDDPELRARLGAAAFRKVERQFTVEHMTRQYEEIYLDVAGR
jgi:glycosyltransferase involved in cell wall biosynthesis